MPDTVRWHNSPGRRRLSTRPRLEALEDRWLPAVGPFGSFPSTLTLAPQLRLGGDEFANVDRPISRIGRLENAGGSTYFVSIDYGDGGVSTSVMVAPDGSFSLSHVYAEEGSFDVRVSAPAFELTATFSVDVLLAGVPIGTADKDKADPGQTVTVTSPGAQVLYHHSARAATPAAILVATVPVFVATKLNVASFDAGLQVTAAYDVRAINVDPRDAAIVSFHYEGDGLPVLTYHDRAAHRPVPVHTSLYIVDQATRTVTLVLDGRSAPSLGQLKGTVFTIAVPVGGGLGAAPPISIGAEVNASIAILLSQKPVVAGGVGDLSRGPLRDPVVVAVLLGSALPGVTPARLLASGSPREVTRAAEGGPLSELPWVPAVLTDLPGATLTPAGSDPATFSNDGSSSSSSLSSPDREDPSQESPGEEIEE